MQVRVFASVARPLTGQLAVLRGWRRVAAVASPAVIGQSALLPNLSALLAGAEGEKGAEGQGLGETRVHSGGCGQLQMLCGEASSLVSMGRCL